jgi:hypothetical protein
MSYVVSSDSVVAGPQFDHFLIRMVLVAEFDLLPDYVVYALRWPAHVTIVLIAILDIVR